MSEELTANLSVDEVLSRWPAAIPVFLRHRMGCVGCAMSGFDTLQDVAGTYHLGLESFLAELRKAARSEAALPPRAAGAPGEVLSSPRIS